MVRMRSSVRSRSLAPQSFDMKKIQKSITKFGFKKEDIEVLGEYKCKIKIDNLDLNKEEKKKKKIILVTATSPTPFGEGKTTMSIALNDAMNILKQKSVLCLREPSLGPVFGIKGGAIGAGRASLKNGSDINLHFTGDFHAITSANNLLVSIIDNHIFQGNILNIDKENIFIKRCLDINDRSLRGQFVITAASDMMAIWCMSRSIKDLRNRLNKYVVATTLDNRFVTVKDLKCVDSVMLLLTEAMKPNITLSEEGNLVFVHGGPFANIALGCNSIIATNTALKYSDYVITESGFGSDLGAEKFINIKQREFDLPLEQVIIVTTLRSIKYNSILQDKSDNIANIKSGIVNLTKHIENIKKFGLKVTVALNVFDTDKEKELDFVTDYFDREYCRVIKCYPYNMGGQGVIELAKEIINFSKKSHNKSVIKNYKDTKDFYSKIKYIYNKKDSIKTKIEKIVKNIYGADRVFYSDIAENKIKLLESNFDSLPVCIAKTQYSFSDDEKKLGAPTGFDFTINDIKLNSGAGFIVAIAGKIMLMPGLGKESRYLKMKVNDEGMIEKM